MRERRGAMSRRDFLRAAGGAAAALPIADLLFPGAARP